jgi:hypothetical protein
LQQVQRLLDVMNAGGAGAGGEMRFVRDARWLIQTAQGPLTQHVKPYFITADNVRALGDEIRLEIHKAGVVLAGGHLRSQLRHLSSRTRWAFDDPRLLALTRSSNSMDMALLVRDLVPLLEAYSAACTQQDIPARHALADAILQGLSADPELLVTRLDLLGPSTMIEELFIDRGDAQQEAGRSGGPGGSVMGEVHREYLARYGDLIARAAEPLQQDSRALDPSHAAYSPLGIVYGFCTDLYANMVLNTLRSPSASALTIEDMFDSRERLDEKRRQASDWERLPKSQGERDPFEHSTEFASHIYARMTVALDARAARPAEPNASSVRNARLYVVPRGAAAEFPVAQPAESAVAQGFGPLVSAQEHCLTSDAARARTTGATPLPADRLIADRAEGRLLASAECDGHWFAVSKVPLTLYTSQGKDAVITDVPLVVVDVLRLVCPEALSVLPEE